MQKSSDVVRRAPYMQPNLPFGVLRGPVYKMRERVAKLERTGQIRRLGPGVQYWESGQSLLAVPYEPLRSLADVRRRTVLKASGVAVMGAGAAAALLAALWEARFVLMYMAGGLALTVLSVAWLVSRVNHGGVCAGLHCSGCRG